MAYRYMLVSPLVVLVRSVVAGLVVFGVLQVSIAQELNERFSHIDTSDGLSNDWVRCFFQDEQGMIWIGTSDSLDRYDGREIKSYRPEVGNASGQQNVTVNAISKKEPGFLWVATNMGLLLYDQENESFEKFDKLPSDPFLHVMEDSRGRGWFASSQGLYVVDFGSGELRKFIPDLENERSLPNEYVNTVFEDSSGVIWVGSKNGLSVFNESSETFTTYKTTSSPNGLSSNDVLGIAEDQQGRLWLATSHGGLELVTRNESGELLFRVICGGQGIRLLVDRSNILWFAKGGDGGLIRIDLNEFTDQEKPKIHRYSHELGNEWSLGYDSVFSVFEDSMGDIWVGLYGRGVDYLSRRAKAFKVERKGTDPLRGISENMVTGFFEEEDYFWIGTAFGLERRSKIDGSYKRFIHNIDTESSIGGNPVFSIFKDSRGNLWAAGWTTGLNRYDYETETFEHYMPSPSETSIGARSIFDIMEDDRGNLWISTYGGGLNRFVYETGEFERYIHDSDTLTSIARDYVVDAVQSQSGEMYVSVYSSLERFDLDTGLFEHFPHGSDDNNGNGGGEIVGLFEDSSGWLWLATTAGLERFDSERGTFQVFTVKNGLPSDSIQAIQEDAAGNLWVSTSYGLSKFEDAVANPQAMRFRNITKEEGLSSNQFNGRAAYIGLDGMFYFGSSNGYTHFRPEEIGFNEVAPSIVLTDILRLETSPDSPLAYRPISRNANSSEVFELLYSNTNFVIKFAALNYLNPEKNQYRYMLEGYDGDWINAGTSNSVTYTHLPLGEYTFRVTGSNNDGIWSEETKELAILVLPPWWKMFWVRVVFIGIFVVTLMAIYRSRSSLIRRKREVLENRVQERTSELRAANFMLGEKQKEITAHHDHLEQMVQERTKELEEAKIKAEKSDRMTASFLANMSHEIRTPMNAIIGFSNLLKGANITDKKREEFIEVIDRNGRTLLVLIDDILDISLIQSDQIRLYEETFAVDEIFYELRDFYRMRGDKAVRLMLVNERELKGLSLTADSVRFRQVIGNLLTNAYKYTDSGRVTFGCSVKGDEVLFEVTDTGMGINSQDQEKIFDHFYKVEENNAKLYPGTGIGLSICRKLVNKMGGKIWVESEVGKGSRFSFTLPKGKAANLENSQSTISEYGSDLSGMTVLLAEDDRTNHELVVHLLEEFGVTVIRAENGKQAEEFVAANRNIDMFVVLMDIKMPVMDGIEACTRIKKMDSNIPVIAVTAYAQASDKERIADAGFDGFLSKPINRSVLISLLSKHASRAEV